MDTKKIQTLKTPLIKSTVSFDLFIPREVEAKIRHLCSVVHDVEWSGTLFYKYSGSIDAGDFKVTCVDLFVMDIGSSAYTEFKESVDVISYRAEHDLLGDDIFEGLIHSHNNMSTFFSGTDCSTLSEEGTNTNHFVSLIVNNAGVYTAAVTRRVVTESIIEAIIKTTSSKYYDTYNGDRIMLSQDDVKEETKQDVKSDSVVEYFELKVTKEDAVSPFQDIDARLAEIRKNKARVVNTVRTYSQGYKPYTPSYNTYGGRSTYNGYPYPSVFDDDDLEPDIRDPYNVRGHIVSSASGGSGSSFQEKKEEVDEVPLCLQERFDEDIIKHISLQLLTSSLIINSDTVSASDWVKRMDTIYEKRFGYLDIEAHPSADKNTVIENNSRLKTWLESLIDFLVYTRDEDLISRLNVIAGTEDYEYDETDTTEVCAYDMCGYLLSLPPSYVKDVMLNILYTYIPDGVKVD